MKRLARIALWIITVLVVCCVLQACSTSKDFSRPKYGLEKRHPR